MTVQWHRFDYNNKRRTCPPSRTGLCWVVDDTDSGVTIGEYDGYTWRVGGSDDCSVSWWAPINYPPAPDEHNQEGPL